MKNCPKKNCIIGFIAVFVFLILYGMLVHGHLLMADYQATANLWRSQPDMEALGAWWLVYYALLAMVVTCMFKKFRKVSAICNCGPECQCSPNCPCKTAAAECGSCCPIKSGGLCFGLKIGLIMGLMMGASYLYMPIPLSLAVKWFAAYLVEGLGIGVILGIAFSGKNGGMCVKKEGQ